MFFWLGLEPSEMSKSCWAYLNYFSLIAWLCTRDDDFKNSQIVIVTGPNIDLAIGLIRRLKRIFETKLGVRFDDLVSSGN